MNNTLIIEISYPGLGDHLFHSHLPRIAKESKKFDKVFISSNSLFRHPDNKRIVWELNPYIDGFVEESGKKCDISMIVSKLDEIYFKTGKKEHNILDEVMLFFEIDDGKRMHEPEIYYKPIYKEEYNKSIFDPNFFSYIGDVNNDDINYTIRKNNIKIDALMYKISDKTFSVKSNSNAIQTKELAEFCDLIFSCNHLYCLTSGTATLAASLHKGATVLWGEGQHLAFQHSTLHNYIEIKQSPKTILLNLLKSPYRLIRYKLLIFFKR